MRVARRLPGPRHRFRRVPALVRRIPVRRDRLVAGPDGGPVLTASTMASSTRRWIMAAAALAVVTVVATLSLGSDRSPAPVAGTGATPAPRVTPSAATTAPP